MPITHDSLDGLRVLVTGGSRGLGAATVRRFVAAGASVLTASRRRPEEDSGARFIAADLSTQQGVAELG
ncbi:SDR family NAD(P)-dependent oxidoreductase, partial [Streptomyces sp. NPDC000188]